MNEAGDDNITPHPEGARQAFKTILFLPGATPAMVVNGIPQSEGWVGQCPAAEADELCRRRLAIDLPDDWPDLPPPAAYGEPLPAYVERAVDGHKSVLAILRLGEPLGLTISSQAMVRPGERTVQQWGLEFPPDHRFYWIDNHHHGTVLFHFCQYLRHRLLVQLFDHLRANTWSVRAHRADDVDYTSRPVSHGLFGHPDMTLHYRPGGDWFRPIQRHGWPVPAVSLPSFSVLTLLPQPAAAWFEGGAPQKQPLPPFNAREAKALLVAKKLGGDWAVAPTEAVSRDFLLLNYRGVPNDLHRQIRREVWPDIRRGPRPKPRPAN
jgi:hypothetical protein